MDDLFEAQYAATLQAMAMLNEKDTQLEELLAKLPQNTKARSIGEALCGRDVPLKYQSIANSMRQFFMRKTK